MPIFVADNRSFTQTRNDEQLSVDLGTIVRFSVVFVGDARVRVL